MKQYIFIIVLTLCMVSCTQHSKHWETLAQIESLMEERPDSALNVLQEIDKEELSGKEEKAKHALLLSMALDKNVIDRTDLMFCNLPLIITKTTELLPINCVPSIIKEEFSKT